MMPQIPLWLVVWVNGMIGVTIGPLPYGWPECRDRAAELESNIAAENPNVPVLVVCTLSFDRPQLGSRRRPGN